MGEAPPHFCAQGAASAGAWNIKARASASVTFRYSWKSRRSDARILEKLVFLPLLFSGSSRSWTNLRTDSREAGFPLSIFDSREVGVGFPFFFFYEAGFSLCPSSVGRRTVDEGVRAIDKGAHYPFFIITFFLKLIEMQRTCLEKSYYAMGLPMRFSVCYPYLYLYTLIRTISIIDLSVLL